MESIRGKRALPSQKSRSLLFEEIILKSWWVILFILLCYFGYEHAYHRKIAEEHQLQRKLLNLEHERVRALSKLEDLTLQMASHEDEGWIELLLMERLGLVPEGQTKVHFSP